MQALYVPAAGEQPVVDDLPTPTLTSNGVLVRVKAAGLNAFDNLIAAGVMSGYVPHEYPLTLGRDAAGVVTAVGEDVTDIHVGDRVIGHVLFRDVVREGTLAEYALIAADSLTPLPEGMSFAEGAALPLAGAAALAAVDGTDATDGQVYLVNGASGGVGGFVVQLLASRGVTVIGTAGPEDTDRLTSLGAAHVIDYTAGPVLEQVQALYPHGVDGLVELVAQTPDASPYPAVKAGGIVSTTTAHPTAETLAAVDIRQHTMRQAATTATLAALTDLAMAGTIHVDVAASIPLSAAATALLDIAAGRGRGKTVVVFDN